MHQINIAVDGHSSCGKSTIAKALAKKLSYLYVDSGAMYRSIALFAKRHQLIDRQEVKDKELILELANISIAFKIVDGLQHTFLNDEDVELEIRSIEISQIVSQIAKISEVRKFLVKQQKKLGEDKGVVMDGRDIGTVVFPSAELKFFVTARTEVRAQRRYDEMIAKGFEKVSLEEIKNNIEERDFLDSHRLVSPLIQANDAILIDTSDLAEEEQLDIAYSHYKKTMEDLGN